MVAGPPRERPGDIASEGIEVVPLDAETFDAGAGLLSRYESLNVFDAAHLGHALELGEPIVSTDALYPEISGVEHLDPREI